MTRRLLQLGLLGAVFASGCGDGSADGSGGTGGGGPIDGLEAIVVTPGQLEITVDGSALDAVPYTATGTFDDGASRDITAEVVFSLEDPTLGTFRNELLTPTSTKGGETTVAASAGAISGFANLTLKLERRHEDPDSDLPPDPGSRFGGPVDPERAPALLYPNDGVVLPPNLRILEFHFEPSEEDALFELSFRNDLTDLKVYLRCHTPLNGGCIYTPDADFWRWLAETNRGGDAVEFTVRETDDQGSAVGVSDTFEVSFTADDVRGAIYYWTTSDGTGIMRYDFGASDQESAEVFIGTELTDGTCVGCHALSRDGSKLVAEAGGQNDGRLLLLDVATTTPIVDFGSTDKSVFQSWSPDADQFVGVYADNGATDYNLLLFDGNTGESLPSIDVGATSENPTSHPDWSPEGDRIAFTRMGLKGTNQRMFKGSIEMVTREGNGWSTPEVIVPNESGKNRYYPSFSPDSGLVIFNESQCRAGREKSRECNADSDPTATLWIVPAGPGQTPIRLENANAPGVADNGKTALTNSFPKWSPFVFSRDKERSTRLEWLTFSSTRQYGLRSPIPQSNDESDSATLIWMVAIEPDKALVDGVDPSAPAFALPFQDLDTSNHIAQWTEQIIVVQ